MTAPVSKHSPTQSGAKGVAVTISLEVDTGLVSVLSFVAMGNVTSAGVSANEESIVSATETGGPGIDDRPTSRWTIYVTKGGTGHGTAGDSAYNVNWIALA